MITSEGKLFEHLTLFMDLTSLSFIGLQGLSAELFLFSCVSFPLSSLNKTAKGPQKISLKVCFLMCFADFFESVRGKLRIGKADIMMSI